MPQPPSQLKVMRVDSRSSPGSSCPRGNMPPPEGERGPVGLSGPTLGLSALCPPVGPATTPLPPGTFLLSPIWVCTCVFLFPYYLALLTSTSCPSPAAQLKAPWDALARGLSAPLPRPGRRCSRGPGQALLWLIRIVSRAHPPHPHPHPQSYSANTYPVPAICQGLCGAPGAQWWQDTCLSLMALGL